VLAARHQTSPVFPRVLHWQPPASPPTTPPSLPPPPAAGSSPPTTADSQPQAAPHISPAASRPKREGEDAAGGESCALSQAEGGGASGGYTAAAGESCAPSAAKTRGRFLSAVRPLPLRPELLEKFESRSPHSVTNQGSSRARDTRGGGGGGLR